ncbi:hypothetical protein HZA75_08055, partial [Candidatus Roizmanbacteria bacterium]|nr:hypothetical protein [Candidatus Roizmanbacteria bacterium]
GYLFDKLEESSLIDKVKELTGLSKEEYFDMRQEARKTAEGFSEERFVTNIKKFIKSKLT